MLTKATVFPNLKMLAKHFPVIYLATIERRSARSADIPQGVLHIPYYSFTGFPRFIEKFTDLLFFSWKVLRLSRKARVDVVICRGAMAAAFGVFIFKIFRIPFMVESFEPHADYMMEGNVWRKGSLEYRFQKWIENQSEVHANYLMPVTHNYANHLIQKGVSAQRIAVMPCCVDLETFKFKENSRKAIRERLGISQKVKVGIYVGKFGDIYYKEESFGLFKKAFDFFNGNFFLIILTPQDANEVTKQLAYVKYPMQHSFITSVKNEYVSDYLSASDFAFSLIRTSPSRKYCSPIKNGEYWANGLPILLTKGVGDDEDIIVQNNVGVIIDFEKNASTEALKAIERLMDKGRESLSVEIVGLADRYRNFTIISETYSSVFRERLLTNS